MVDVPQDFFIGIVDISHHQDQAMDWDAYKKGGGWFCHISRWLRRSVLV